MANCTTCRHNDKRKRYCSLKGAHTDLGYVLNCVAWEATDELKMRELRAENAKLRDLCASLYEFAMSEYPDGTELNFADRMRELKIEVD